MYAATPSLDALKLLPAKLAARERERWDKGIDTEDCYSSVMFHVDVRRAYFYAHAKPETHVEMPEEDRTGEGRVWWYLIKAMHGTRQAASA